MEEELVLEEKKKKHELPKGWAGTKLDNVIILVTDKIDPKKSDPKANYIGLEHLRSGGGLDSHGETAGLLSTKTCFRSGDILYGKLRPYLNKHALASFSGLCSTDILVIRCSEAVDSSYLNYYFGSQEFISFANNNSKGINLPRLSPNSLRNYLIALPPLDEQKRIVAKLDLLMEKVEASRERLESVPETLKQFRQRVLAHAVSGKLTGEWRLANSEPYNEKNRSIGSSIILINGFAFKSGDYIEQGLELIKISNIGYGELIEKDQKFLPMDYGEEYKKFLVSRGDILIALTRPITNDTTKVCIYSKDEDALLNQRVAKLTPKDNVVLSKYLFYLLQSPQVKKEIKSNFNETLQPNLSPNDLKEIQVWIPSVEEQAVIVDQVESLFTWADGVEEAYQRAMEKVDKLPQALLTKAFRGELVPQNPADKPAAVLLERIKAERVKQKKKNSKKGS